MTDDLSALIERAVDTAFRRYVPTIIANPPPMLLEDRFVSVPETWKSNLSPIPALY